MHLSFARLRLFVFLFLCCFQTGCGQKVRCLLQKATTVLDGGVVADIKNVATEQVLGGDSKLVKNLISQFEKGQPISTSFDDAIYEAPFLSDFEPNENEYSHLDLQPKTENGAGFRLKSGLYTMNARSFCLKGYTHGPSRGDGHLFAPMKGKRADFVQSIIEHYATRPQVPQQNVQVLLWAIIAGADLKTLGKQYSATLASLFSPEKLLKLTAQGYLEGYTQKYMDDVRGWLGGKIPAELKNLLDADEQIRTMVRENRAFQEIEGIAVLAGVAPREMVREVSRGQWSYHPDGFFVRYFPNGYQQTRVDVYVPFDNAVETGPDGTAVAINQEAKQPKEVVFRPGNMVAAPANRPSQRIGISPLPVNPCGEANSSDQKLANYWKGEANKYLFKDTSKDIKNQSITCAYANIYLKDTKKFKWAGLAALVSGNIGKEEFEKRWKPNITGLMDDLLKGNRAVFDDLFWQHLAFDEKGISEIEKLYCQNALSKSEYLAWKRIAEGGEWQGNKKLLYHEQKDVLQPILYSNHPISWWGADTWGGILINWGNVLKSPVPGDSQTFDSGLTKSIGNFEDRWHWIENHILPKWEEFEENKANKGALMKALQNVCPALSN